MCVMLLPRSDFTNLTTKKRANPGLRSLSSAMSTIEPLNSGQFLSCLDLIICAENDFNDLFRYSDDLILVSVFNFMLQKTTSQVECKLFKLYFIRR